MSQGQQNQHKMLQGQQFDGRVSAPSNKQTKATEIQTKKKKTEKNKITDDEP